MKLSILWLFVILGLSAINRASAANGDSHPYQKIAVRNLFRLQPAPSSQPVPEPEPPPSPRIKLDGITTILSGRHAIITVTEPGSGAKETTYLLGEGQREGKVQMLEINAKARTAKLDFGGTVLTIGFEPVSKRPDAGPKGTF